MKLTVFYDGRCPLCMAEMLEIARLDVSGHLQLEDIHQPDFHSQFPNIDKQRAEALLHAQLADGTMLYGLDANCRAWEIVGHKPWMQVLRWPVIRVFADLGYKLFARYRSTFALLLTGKRYCEVCKLPGSGQSEQH